MVLRWYQKIFFDESNAFKMKAFTLKFLLSCLLATEELAFSAFHSQEETFVWNEDSKRSILHPMMFYIL